MRFNVEFTSQAKTFLIHLSHTNSKLAHIFQAHIDKLPETYQYDPFLKGTHLKGARRHRVGDYRIIYRVIQDRLMIYIIEIGHRREVYDR